MCRYLGINRLFSTSVIYIPIVNQMSLFQCCSWMLITLQVIPNVNYFIYALYMRYCTYLIKWIMLLFIVFGIFFFSNNPARTIHQIIFESRLVHRLRRWFNNNPTMGQCLVCWEGLDSGVIYFVGTCRPTIITYKIKVTRRSPSGQIYR